MSKFGTLDSSDKTLAIVGDRWWPQTAKQEDNLCIKSFYVIHGKSVMSAQMLEVSLLGVEAVLRLERDAWSMA